MTFIYPGRLQPPHRDHIAFLRDVAHDLQSVGHTLHVGLIVPRFDLDGEHPLVLESAAHHEPQRNPFSYEERVQMLRRALPELVGSAIRVVALPPPERAWCVAEAMFPEPRVWIVPQAGESFDDSKAAFFVEKGDAVIRPVQRTTTDGYVVRSLLAARDPTWKEHVTPEIAAFITERAA